MANLLELFFERNWVLKRLDNDEVIKGQFHAEGITESVSSSYAEQHALNRQSPIMQFLHGNSETIEFTGRLFAARARPESIGIPISSIPILGKLIGETVDEDIKKLKEWVRRDDKLKRPPLLSFSLGDGHVQMEKCVLTAVDGITYDRPTALGALRHVTFNVKLSKFVDFDLSKFSLSLGQFEALVFGNTRFHTASRGDYYETLAGIEYNNPLLGDVIRKQNPSKPNLQIGDVTLLPSSRKVVGQRVTQQSVPLKTGFDRRDTPQRALRLEFFRLRERPRASFIVQA